MRSGLGLAAIGCVGACNWVFGLENTQALDAAFFDAPPDVPFVCNEIGMPPPTFSKLLVQFSIQNCFEYNESRAANRAVAICNFPQYQVGQGGIGDAELTPIPGFEQEAGVTLDQPRLAPEGDELLVRKRVTSGSTQLERYRLVGNLWMKDPPITDMLAVDAIIGRPSHGPSRRLMINDGGTYIEYSLDDTGALTPLVQYGPSMLGITNIDDVVAHLSADGLRMTFVARRIGQTAQQVLYTDRTALTEQFRVAVPLPGIPVVHDAFLTDDCDRVYFSAVQSMFYAQQE